MVKRVMLMTSLMSMICVAEPLTNATALIGVQLTANEIARLPSCDATSPDTVFLGTIKALRTGNLRELYYHFETNYLYSLTGHYDLQSISDATISSFQTVMTDTNFSNVVIVAYSMANSNQVLRVTSSLQENYLRRTLTEPLILNLRAYPNGWKIVSYDDDKWDE